LSSTGDAIAGFLVRNSCVAFRESSARKAGNGIAGLAPFGTTAVFRRFSSRKVPRRSVRFSL
jgi:hypothetical protein